MTDPDGLLVSVVVVNYEGAGHLPACLTALAEQTLPRHHFEVIVVENASTDGSARLIRDRFPWCRLVPSPTNLGFAAGNNLGLRSVERIAGGNASRSNHDCAVRRGLSLSA